MWAVKVYLNEAGWDGEYTYAYFTTEALAEEAMALLRAKWDAEVDADDPHDLELSVVQALPNTNDPQTWADNAFMELYEEID